jgi:predicted CoA-binding protein
MARRAPAKSAKSAKPTVAVIGASSNRGKYGNKAVRAFRNQGYRVIPINPAETEVEGERAYRSVLDYPKAIEEATMYVPPRVGVKVLDELAKKGVRTVWLNPGAGGPDLMRRAATLGLEVLAACSIRGIGEDPGNY